LNRRPLPCQSNLNDLPNRAFYLQNLDYCCNFNELEHSILYAIFRPFGSFETDLVTFWLRYKKQDGFSPWQFKPLTNFLKVRLIKIVEGCRFQTVINRNKRVLLPFLTGIRVCIIYSGSGEDEADDNCSCNRFPLCWLEHKYHM
jgi:hypothetical protein